MTRFLALGIIPVECAIIDAGITPYRLPLSVCCLACLRDCLGFKPHYEKPEVSGGGISAGALDVAGTRPCEGIRCTGSVSEDLFRSNYSQYPSGQRTTIHCRSNRLKRTVASVIGTVMRRRKRAVATSDSSGSIFRMRKCAVFRKWVTLNS